LTFAININLDTDAGFFCFSRDFSYSAHNI
jgi:hypothetical protein